MKFSIDKDKVSLNTFEKYQESSGSGGEYVPLQSWLPCVFNLKIAKYTNMIVKRGLLMYGPY